MTEPKHPRQPLVRDEDGVVRFKRNNIVVYLLDHGGIDMNKLAALAEGLHMLPPGAKPFTKDDQVQFAQLIGYSVDGFGDLRYVSPAIAVECDNAAAALLLTTQKKSY